MNIVSHWLWILDELFNTERANVTNFVHRRDFVANDLLVWRYLQRITASKPESIRFRTFALTWSRSACWLFMLSYWFCLPLSDWTQQNRSRPATRIPSSGFFSTSLTRNDHWTGEPIKWQRRGCSSSRLKVELLNWSLNWYGLKATSTLTFNHKGYST